MQSALLQIKQRRNYLPITSMANHYTGVCVLWCVYWGCNEWCLRTTGVVGQYSLEWPDDCHLFTGRQIGKTKQLGSWEKRCLQRHKPSSWGPKQLPIDSFLICLRKAQKLVFAQSQPNKLGGKKYNQFCSVLLDSNSPLWFPCLILDAIPYNRKVSLLLFSFTA